MTHRQLAMIAALACSSAHAAARGAGVSLPETRTVHIAQFAFSPAELDVSAGDTIVWSNTDALRHTSTSDSAVWASPELADGERFVWVAARAGRFPYHCAAHPVMHGLIVVR